MTAPVDFMRRYRNVTVGYVRFSGSMCIEERATISKPARLEVRASCRARSRSPKLQ